MSSSYSQVQRIENGSVGLQSGELVALLDLYGVTDAEERHRLERLRAEGRQRGWWSGYRSVLRDSYRTLIGIEAEAVGRLDFASVIVPGLLQTEAYARAVMASAKPRMSEETITKRVEVRMRRQETIVRDDDPLDLHVIFDEACIQRRVGDGDTWREQLAHLVALSKRPNIIIQIVPFEAGALADGLPSFTIFQFADSLPDIAFVDLPTGDLFAEGNDAELYKLHFDTMTTAALPPALSVTMIQDLLE